MLAAEIVLVGAAFCWVAIYSYLIDTGHDEAYYRAYAEKASPWVALVLGGPVFFGVCRKIAVTRKRALAVFAVFCAIEIPLLLSAEMAHIPVWFLPVSLATKLAGCYFGGKQDG